METKGEGHLKSISDEYAQYLFGYEHQERASKVRLEINHREVAPNTTSQQVLHDIHTGWESAQRTLLSHVHYYRL